MYSPKISEELVPVLYRLAKEKRQPMTRLVDSLIRQSLASGTPPVNEPVTGLLVRELATTEPRSATAA